MLIRLNLFTILGLISIVSGADIPALSFMDVIASQKELSSLYRVLSTPEMDKVVSLLSSSDRKFTVFAPTNEALAELKEVSQTSKASVADIMLYHIVEGEAKSSQIKSLHFAPTMFSVKEQTQALKIARKEKGIELSSGPAPPANVIKEDFPAKNGQLHIIDKILDVPLTVSKTLQKAGLTKFLAAATQNDLIVTMDRQRGVTVLAPSNEAMDKLMAQNPEMSDHELYQVLKLLVVPNQIRYTNRILTPVTVESLGGSLVMERSENNILVNGVKITNADIITTSGVMHVIDEIPVRSKAIPSSDHTSKPTPQESDQESNSEPLQEQEQQLALQPEAQESIPQTQESIPQTQESIPQTQESIPQIQEFAPQTQESTPQTQFPLALNEFMSNGKVRELIAASLKAIEESAEASETNLSQAQPESEVSSLAETLDSIHSASAKPTTHSTTFSELSTTSSSSDTTPHTLTESTTESVLEHDSAPSAHQLASEQELLNDILGTSTPAPAPASAPARQQRAMF